MLEEKQGYVGMSSLPGLKILSYGSCFAEELKQTRLLLWNCEDLLVKIAMEPSMFGGVTNPTFGALRCFLGPFLRSGCLRVVIQVK